MSDYFDNQHRWSYSVTKDCAQVITDHGDHIHRIDISKITFGDMCDNTGKAMGDAHRAAPHDKK